MPPPDEMLINVQREWNGWQTAMVRLGDLQHIHWFQPSGAPRRLVHAYVSCADIVDGHIPHDCERTPAPHQLLVCILKCHSIATAYAEVSRRADDQTLSQEHVLQPAP